jgi:hypothetical protein
MQHEVQLTKDKDTPKKARFVGDFPGGNVTVYVEKDQVSSDSLTCTVSDE